MKGAFLARTPAMTPLSLLSRSAQILGPDWQMWQDDTDVVLAASSDPNLNWTPSCVSNP